MCKSCDVSGAGLGMAMLSNIVIVQQYFNRKRAVASGLSLLGISFGNILTGPLVQWLIDTYGWRGTLIILSGISLQNLAFAATYRPVNVKPRKVNARSHQGEESIEKQGGEMTIVDNQKPDDEAVITPCQSLCMRFKDRLCDFSIFRNPALSMCLVGSFLMAQGLTAFTTHNPSRAVVYGVTRDQAAWLVSYSAIASLVTRFLVSFIANMRCVNRVLLYSDCTTIAGAGFMLNTLAVDFPTIVAFTVTMGALYGKDFGLSGNLSMQTNFFRTIIAAPHTPCYYDCE